MKRFISTLTIFLFVSFSINTTQVLAQPNKFKEGFYSITNLGLLANVSYSVQTISNYNGFIIVFDSDQKIQQAISLEPNSIKPPSKNHSEYG